MISAESQSAPQFILQMSSILSSTTERSCCVEMPLCLVTLLFLCPTIYRELGFEDFEESLEEFLDAYRKETEDQKSSNKGSTAGQDHMDIVSAPIRF